MMNQQGDGSIMLRATYPENRKQSRRADTLARTSGVPGAGGGGRSEWMRSRLESCTSCQTQYWVDSNREA